MHEKSNKFRIDKEIFYKYFVDEKVVQNELI